MTLKILKTRNFANKLFQTILYIINLNNNLQEKSPRADECTQSFTWFMKIFGPYVLMCYEDG